jgi:hypothetical protein
MSFGPVEGDWWPLWHCWHSGKDLSHNSAKGSCIWEDMRWRTFMMAVLVVQWTWGAGFAAFHHRVQVRAEDSQSDQEASLNPSGAYQYAIQPLQDARRSPDDLTDAERWAWLVAKKRAATACDAYLAKLEEIQGEELFSLGQLCIVGDNALAARESLRRYLDLPNPVSRRLAMMAMTKAQVKIGSITEAVHLSEQLLSEYGYDSETNDLISYVIDNAEGREVTLEAGVELAERRMPDLLVNLERLISSGIPTDKDKFSATQLFQDGLTLCDLYRQTKMTEKMQECVQKMSVFTADKNWQDTYDMKLMKGALDRFQLVGEQPAARKMSASILLLNGLMKDTEISLRSGRVVLFVFSLATPSTVRSWSDIHAILRSEGDVATKTYAITTFSLNGELSEGDKGTIVRGLQGLRSRLSPAAPIYITSDKELHAFGFDSYPSVVVISEGRIVYCSSFEDSAGSSGNLTRAIRLPQDPKEKK